MEVFGHKVHRGYIKLFRKMLDWEWYQDGNTFRLFLHLLMKANHKEKQWQGITIKKGQLITGLNRLHSETKISIQSLRTSLIKLENTKEINRQTTNKNSIITLTNYSSYQVQETESTSKLTINQQSINNQSTTNKNVNNEKNDKKQKDKEFVLSVLSYLNKATNKNLRYSSGHSKHILARKNENYTLEEIKKVIDIKTKDWLNNPLMQKHLTTKTLFGNNFDTYLNELTAKKKIDNKYKLA